MLLCLGRSPAVCGEAKWREDGDLNLSCGTDGGSTTEISSLSQNVLTPKGLSRL